MAQYTFVTAVGVEKVGLWGRGVLTDVTYDDETVNVLSQSEIRKLIAEETDQLAHNIVLQNRKLAKAAEQAATAAKDAAAAREMVEKIVETAREAFSDVIEELLAPHYRRLAALAAAAGIDVPEESSERKEPTKKRSDAARNTPPPAAGGSPLSEGAKKKGKVPSRSRQQKQAEIDDGEPEFDTPKRRVLAAKTRTKKTTAATRKTSSSSRAKSKGVRPCRKK